MSNDIDIWTLQREPHETDAEYVERAAIFRAEFKRQLPDSRTIEQALANGDALGVDFRERAASGDPDALRILEGLPGRPPENRANIRSKPSSGNTSVIW